MLDEAGLTVEEMRAYLGDEALARLVAVLSAPRDGGQPGGQPGRSTWSTTSRRRARRRSSTSPSACSRGARPRRDAGREHAAPAAIAARADGELVLRLVMLQRLTEKLRVIVHRGLQETGQRRPGPEARARGGQHRERSARQADSRRGRAAAAVRRRRRRDAGGAGAGAGGGLLRRQGPPHEDQDRRAAARRATSCSASSTSPTTRRSARGSSPPPSRKSSRSWSSPARPWAASHELTQLDVQGELKRRVFPAQ